MTTVGGSTFRPTLPLSMTTLTLMTWRKHVPAWKASLARKRTGRCFFQLLVTHLDQVTTRVRRWCAQNLAASTSPERLRDLTVSVTGDTQLQPIQRIC